VKINITSCLLFGKDELARWSNEIYHPYSTHCSWWVAGIAFIQANSIGKLRRDLLKSSARMTPSRSYPM